MPDFDDDAIEAGRLLFARQCDFRLGVARLNQLPLNETSEVAFAGRSNVGKSSLINALTGRRTLARTSNTPGRTRQLNFFDLAGRLTIVDMPGYGYAKAPKGEISQWNRLIRDYLRGRVELRCLCLLIDARHGIKPSDEELMDMLDEAAVSYQIVLTKADKVKAGALAALGDAVRLAMKTRAAARPDVLTTSAQKGTGVPELRAFLATLAEPEPLV